VLAPLDCHGITFRRVQTLGSDRFDRFVLSLRLWFLDCQLARGKNEALTIRATLKEAINGKGSFSGLRRLLPALLCAHSLLARAWVRRRRRRRADSCSRRCSLGAPFAAANPHHMEERGAISRPKLAPGLIYRRSSNALQRSASICLNDASLTRPTERKLRWMRAEFASRGRAQGRSCSLGWGREGRRETGRRGSPFFMRATSILPLGIFGLTR